MDALAKEKDKKFEKSSRAKMLVLLAVVIVAMGLGAAFALLHVSKDPAFCSSCHIIKPYYESWKSGNLLASKHAAKGVECLDCHQKTYLEKAQEGLHYVTGSYSNPLKPITFPWSRCQDCHRKDFDKVKAATNFEQSNPHDNHLGEIDCTLCHKMHRQSEVYCAQCHEFTWFKKLDSSWKVGASQS